MKSLNRTLSLVLVLVMVLGLFGVASAATFTDDTSIQYKEAVDVMTGIGAINGMGDGTFAPKGTLTRAQAAKLVAYTVLGADVATLLPVKASSFKDVDAAYAWAIPSIEYLVQKGVINGLGDGTFNPAGNVTGYQLAKMLLVALGVKGEFTGTSWELNTAIAASKAGLLKNSKAASFSVAATREEAALYCFNALFYSATGASNDKIWGITGWDTNNKPVYGWIEVPTAASDSIAKTVYPTLSSNATGTDLFGRPAITWSYKLKAISSTVTSAPVLTFTTGTTGKAIYTAAINAGYKFGTTVDVIRNGGTANSVAVSSYSTSTAAEGGNGTAIEVYVDSTTGVVTKIIVVATYIGPVTISAKDDAATTTIDERELTIVANGTTLKVSGLSKTPGFDAVYAAAATAAAAGQQAMALVTPKGDNSASVTAQTVAVPESKTLTATAYTGTTFTAGGTVYKYSDTCTTQVAAFTPFVAFFDSYGYVIYTTSVSAVTNYAVVLNAAEVSDDWGTTGTYKAELLMPDGTRTTVLTATNYSGLKDDVVTYVVGNGSVYTLTAAGTAVDYASKTLSLKTGVSAFTWDGATYYGNAKTLYVVRSGAGTTVSPFTYKTYLGLATVPSFGGSVSGQVIHTNGVASVVYLQSPTPTGTTTSDKIFILDAAYETVNAQINGSTVVYYVAHAVVNGEIKTLNLTGTPTLGVYNAMTTNAAGLVTLGSSAKISTEFSSKAIASANGVLKIDGVYYGYTTDCAVYTYNTTTGVITASSIAAIVAGTTSGSYTTNTNGQITSIYIAG